MVAYSKKAADPDDIAAHAGAVVRSEVCGSERYAKLDKSRAADASDIAARNI
jgi:hypothetical protein